MLNMFKSLTNKDKPAEEEFNLENLKRRYQTALHFEGSVDRKRISECVNRFFAGLDIKDVRIEFVDHEEDFKKAAMDAMAAMAAMDAMAAMAAMDAMAAMAARAAMAAMDAMAAMAARAAM